MYSMYEDHTASAEGLIYETADRRHPNEKIFVVRILNRDSQVSYARLRVFGRDGLGANRDYMCDTAFCQRACRLCRNEAKESNEIRVHKCSMANLETENTHFPK